MGYRDTLATRYTENAPADPQDMLNVGVVPAEGGQYSPVDDSLYAATRAAAANRMAQTALPEPEGRSGFLDYSLLENIVALPGNTALEAGIETAGARLGELIYSATGVPKAAMQGVGLGEYYPEWADQAREYTRKHIIEPILGNRELIAQEYPNISWDNVKRLAEQGDYGEMVWRGLGMVTKEGIGSIPDMVALMSGPLGQSAYAATRTSEIAAAREQASDEPNTPADIAIAAATALTVQALDRYALLHELDLSKLTTSGANKIASVVSKARADWAMRAAKAAGTEAVTEAVQEHIEYVGSLVKEDLSDFEKFFDSPEDFESALVGAIIGGGVGAGIVLTGEGAAAIASRRKGPSEDVQAAVDATREAPVDTRPLGTGVLPETPAAPLQRVEPTGTGPSAPPADRPLAPPTVGAPPRATAIPSGVAGPQSPDLVTPGAAEQQPLEQGPEEPVTGPVVELPSVVAQGTGEEGQYELTPVSPVKLPEPVPETIDEKTLVDTIKSGAVATQEAQTFGSRYRDTGFGRLVERAIRGIPSRKEPKPRKRTKFGPVTPQASLEAQQKRVEGARSRTPAGRFVSLFEDAATIAYTVEQKLAARIEELTKPGTELTKELANELNQLRQVRGKLAEQLDELQELAEIVRRNVKGDEVVPTTNYAIGMIVRNAKALENLGLPVRDMILAKTPAAARKALDKAANEARRRVEEAQKEGLDLQLPARQRISPEAAREMKNRDIRAVMAMNEARGHRGSSEGSAPTRTIEDKYVVERTNEEGDVVREVTLDKNTPEYKEWRRQIAEERRKAVVRKYGEVTDFTTEEPLKAPEERPKKKPAKKVRAENIDRYLAEKEIEDTSTAVGSDMFLGSAAQDAKGRAEELEAKRKATSESEAVKKLSDLPLQTQLSVLRGDLEAAEGEEAKKLQARIETLEQKLAAQREAARKAKEAEEPKGGRGVSKARLKRAAEVFRSYKEAFRSRALSGARATPPEVLLAAARQTKRHRIGPKGLPAIKVYNPATNELDTVMGAYPKQIIKRDEKTGHLVVSRAEPHAPGTKAPFKALEGKRFYYPEDVVMVQGNPLYAVRPTTGSPRISFEKVQLPEGAGEISPRALDKFMTQLGRLPIDWSKFDDLQALAQYLLTVASESTGKGASSGKKRTVSPVSSSGTTKEPAENVIITEEPVTPAEEPVAPAEAPPATEQEEQAAEPDEFDELDEDTIKELVELLSDMGGEPGENPRATAESLFALYKKAADEVEAMEKALPIVEAEANAAPVIDDVMTVDVPEWPSGAPFEAQMEGGEVVDPFGIETGVKPKKGEGLAQTLARGVVAMANMEYEYAVNRLETLEGKLEELKEKLGDIRAKRREKEAGSGPQTPGTGDTGDGAEISPVEGPAGSGAVRREANPDRVPNLEPLAPQDFKPLDLYEQFRKPGVVARSALDGARAYRHRGPDGRLTEAGNLTDAQIFGAATIFSHWKKGNRGVLNMDGTGFGKSRQLAVASDMIAAEEEKQGTRRPILILFPGETAKWKHVFRNYKSSPEPVVEWGLNNKLGDNIAKDMEALGIDPRATYSDGTRKFMFYSYAEVEQGRIPKKTQFAAVMVDEAHEVKGVGVRAKNFTNINTPFYGFFTATPTDKPGQELYYLKQFMRKEGETPEQAEERIADSLFLRKDATTGKWGLPNADRMFDAYLSQLRTRYFDRLAQEGALLSRTYGRKARTYMNRVEDAAVDDPSLMDQEAAEQYEKFKKAAKSPFAPELTALTEHMKVPYMVARTLKRVNEDKNAVIAVFRHTNPIAKLKGTKWEQPALLRYVDELKKAGLRVGVLYGEATPQDGGTIDKFQAGELDVLAVSDKRAYAGLNLNDDVGDHPRYMMIAHTSLEGTAILQILGRHDRSNNRSRPYTEFVAVNNDTDRAYRRGVKRKVVTQETVTGATTVKELDPKIFEADVWEDPTFEERSRELLRKHFTDPVDQRVRSMAEEGASHSPRDLLHMLATTFENDQLAQIADHLETMAANWPEVRVRKATADEERTSAGRYYPATNEIALSDYEAAGTTLLHELIHHGTMQRIVESESVRQQLDDLMRELVRVRPGLVDRFPTSFGMLGTLKGQLEFVSDAMSDPDMIAELDKIRMRRGKALNGFQRFIRWVANALGIPFEARTALEHVMNMPLFRGVEQFDFDTMPLDKLKAPSVTPKAGRFLDDVEEFVRRSRLPAHAKQAWHKGRELMLNTMTLDMIVQTYSKLVDNTVANTQVGGNVLEKLMEVHEAMNARTTQNSQRYTNEIIRPLMQFARKSQKLPPVKVVMAKGEKPVEMTQFEFLAHLMNISGYAQVHFGKPKTDKANRMIAHSAKARVAWEMFHKAAKDPRFSEGMAVYNRIANYFERDRTNRIRVTKGAFLDTIYPNERVPWAQRPLKDIEAKLKEIGLKSDDDLRSMGVNRDALSILKDVLKPGIVPGAYFPLRRYGDYVVTIEGDQHYTNDKERDELLARYMNARDDAEGGRVIYKTVARFDNYADAERFIEHAKTNEYMRVSGVMRTTASAQTILGGTPFSALIQNFDAQLSKMEVDSGVADVARTTFLQALLDLMPEQSTIQSMRARAGVHGATTDIIRALYDYGSSSSYMMASLEFSQRKTKTLNALRMATYEQGDSEDQITLETVRQHLMKRELASAQIVYGPLTGLQRTASDIGFLYFLVGASFNMVNMTQVPLVTQPYLSARYGAKKTLDALTRAYATVGVAPTKELVSTGMSLTRLRGIFSGEDFDRTAYEIVRDVQLADGTVRKGILSYVSDPDQRRMLQQMVDEGHIEATLSMDMGRMSERGHIDANGRPRKVTPWEYLTDWMRTAPHITEVMNRAVTALAAFDLEMQRSKNYDKAVNAARRAVKDTQFVYMAYNDAVIFRNPIGRLALMFKKHVQHMYFLLIRNAAISIGRMDRATKRALKNPRLTKQQRAALLRHHKEQVKIARKTLLYLILTHMMAGGVVGGTPEMMKWLLNLAWWAVGEGDDPKSFDRAVRNAMYDLFGGEKGYGDIGATLASQGLPGFIGMDLSGRVGIDSMLMFNGFDFSSKDALARSVLETAGGPLVSLAMRATVDAPREIRNGDYVKAAQAVTPKALRDVLRAIEIRQRGYTDLSGKTYLDAEDVDWYTFGYKMLGFQTKQESDLYAARDVGYAAKRMNAKRAQLFTRYAKARTPEERRQAIQAMREWNHDNPEFAITGADLARSMKRRATAEARMQSFKGAPVTKRNAKWAKEQLRSY